MQISIFELNQEMVSSNDTASARFTVTRPRSKFHLQCFGRGRCLGFRSRSWSYFRLLSLESEPLINLGTELARRRRGRGARARHMRWSRHHRTSSVAASSSAGFTSLSWLLRAATWSSSLTFHFTRDNVCDSENRRRTVSRKMERVN